MTSIVNIENLTMHYGAKLLFHEFNANLTSSYRYGIVGANGVGKSTFLKLLSRDETPADGNITIPKRASLGILKQDQFRYENDNVIDVVIQGKQKLWDALIEKEKLLTQDINNPNIGYRLGELEETISDNDGYTAMSFAQELLIGLGVKEKYHFGPLSALSGGFKLRCLLAQTLFNQPDILLLDEPTNHLDIITIGWLEKYLKTEYKGILIFISHDRSF